MQNGYGIIHTHIVFGEKNQKRLYFMSNSKRLISKLKAAILVAILRVKSLFFSISLYDQRDSKRGIKKTIFTSTIHDCNLILLDFVHRKSSGEIEKNDVEERPERKKKSRDYKNENIVASVEIVCVSGCFCMHAKI